MYFLCHIYISLIPYLYIIAHFFKFLNYFLQFNHFYFFNGVFYAFCGLTWVKYGGFTGKITEKTFAELVKLTIAFLT